MPGDIYNGKLCWRKIITDHKTAIFPYAIIGNQEDQAQAYLASKKD